MKDISKKIIIEKDIVPYYDIDKGSEMVEYKLEKSICRFCGKEWLTLYLNGCVMFGGNSYSYSFKDDKFVDNGCPDCSAKKMAKDMCIKK